ncbi:hypothetical protein CRP01_17535 [Flavilitoribacter nigricans DSM 23189 = NBRC 102662]|uniref:Uncharacterized protein n=2 Tax=Flavilitoribacter TaxID=2762562 RepID=A0A2D0NAA4_FLAN2|nr:hypothetical protein CRP01_17535 [Flavilitoribacter nigricans DSM 23189 = NBRC 102662]
MKRVRVEYDGNAAIITDDHQHIGEQFNGLMAASLTGLVGPKFKGDFGCPSTYSLDGYTNAHRMLFHFNKHYFFPFVLDNGNSFFFAFEDKRTAENLVLKFNSIGKDQVSIGSMKTPLLYENILGISYSKNVSVVYAKPLADPIVDDPRDYRYYEYIREYDPFTNEEKDIYG